MKILFIENRYKTHFWKALAAELQERGCEVLFLIQNHRFEVEGFPNAVIPYPRKKERVDSGAEFGFIETADRSCNCFAGNSHHYRFYYEKISAVIAEYQPDLVVGEATVFHELLAIQICREEEIVYLNPSSSSYPKNRFSLYQYDTKLAYRGSAETCSDARCDELIEAISQRKIQPDYMLKHQVDQAFDDDKTYPQPGSWRDRNIILQAYAAGERYNTPHPLRKLLHDRRLSQLKIEWNALAAERADSMADKKIILYPLQMQPEANLDVWGQKHRDQAELVAMLAKALPDDCCLLVKANPKVKYELNEALLARVRENKNSVPLALAVKMEEVFPQADLIVTVTGTIAIEAVLSGKPLALLGESVVKGGAGVIWLDQAAELSAALERLAAGFPTATQEEKRALIRRLLSSSYAGLISDPCHAPTCLDAENIKQVATVIHAAVQGK
ncbi:MAG: hypothetical protein Q9O24_08605 [Gammaproteobacteria bacterium]|nr:hypothetical protein [Gammaproteobacteria bacterium]